MPAAAQYTISGRVTDSAGNSIAGATVKIKAAALIKVFTRTNQSGYYTLPLQSGTGTVQVEVSHIGYRTTAATVNTTAQPLHFTLQKSAVLLTGVTVKATPVRINGDTLSYNPATYASRKDRTVEDVMRRIPGIEIAANGEITHNGVVISHYYIEGLDMLGGQYNLANQNIRFDDVEKIQVLQNHQDKRVLDSFETSRQPALNIQLKTSARNKLIGEAMAAAGYDTALLYKATITAMQFKKRKQFLHGIKLANDGTNVGRELTNHPVTPENAAAGIPVEKHRHTLSVSKPAVPPLAERQYLFSNTAMIFTNAIFKRSETSQWKYNLSYLYDKNSSTSYSSATNYFTADTVTIVENQTLYTRLHQLKGGISYVKNAGTIYLNNTFTADAVWQREQSAVTGSNSARQQLNIPACRLQNLLKLYKKIGKRLVQFESNVQYEQQPENLLVEPGQFATFFNSGLPYDNIRQHTRREQLQLTNTGTLTTRWLGLRQKHTVTAAWYRNRFTSLLQKQVTGNTVALSDSFQNNLQQQYVQGGIQSEWIWTSKKCVATFTLPVNTYWLRREDAIQLFSRKEAMTFFLPALSLRLPLHNFWEVTAQGKTGRTAENIQQTALGYVMRSYRNISNNDSALLLNHTQSVNLTIAYRNPLKNIFAWLAAGYTRQENNLLYSQRYTGVLLAKQAVPLSNSTTVRSILSTVSRYFSAVKTSLQINGNFFQINNVLLQNNQLQPVSSRTASVSLKANCKKLKDIYIENNVELAGGRSQVGATEKTGFITLSNTLSCYYFLSPKTTLFTNAAYYLNESPPFGRQQNLLLDAGCRIKTKPCEINIAFSNITNRQQYTWRSIAANANHFISYRLRPVNCMVQCMFSL